MLARRVHIEPTVDELRMIVSSLELHPYAQQLRQRLGALLQLETLLPFPSFARRVLVRVARDDAEWCVEFYADRDCDRLEAAIERAMRPRRKGRR